MLMTTVFENRLSKNLFQKLILTVYYLHTTLARACELSLSVQMKIKTAIIYRLIYVKK